MTVRYVIDVESRQLELLCSRLEESLGDVCQISEA